MVDRYVAEVVSGSSKLHVRIADHLERSSGALDDVWEVVDTTAPRRAVAWAFAADARRIADALNMIAGRRVA